MGYKTCLEEAPISHQEASLIPKEGWAIRAAKKSYRFSDKQKSYLMAKFHIGQTTGRKVDAELVAREMLRARFFRPLNSCPLRRSRPSPLVKVPQYFKAILMTSRMDVQAALEETNFSQAKETVETVQLRHPLVYDHYDLCAMALRNTLKQLKLLMLQRVCEDLGLDVPLPPVRKKAPYLALLEDITSKCSCRK